jgi:hypothetical protein
MSKEATGEYLAEIFSNFNFKDNTTGHYKAKSAFSPNTLATSLKSASYAIEAIMKKIEKEATINSYEHLSQLVKEAEKLIKEGNKILNSAERAMQFGQERIVGKGFEDGLIIIN